MSSRAEDAAGALDHPVAWPRPGEGWGLGKPPFRDEQVGAWVISTYADIEQVLTDPRTFSSQFVLGRDYAAAFDPLRPRIAEDPRVATASTYFRMAIEAADGEFHKRERGLVAKAFTPRRVRAFDGVIRTWCEELTDAMLDRTDVPFVEEFAVPLPTRVIAHMLGLEPEDHRDLKRWSDGFQGPIGDSSRERLEEFVTTAVEFTDYISPIIEERRRAPTDDVISGLVAQSGAGEPLSTTREILPICMALMLGGNETLTVALSGAMLFLVRSPEVQAELRANPELIPTWVEESLRLATPFQLMFRTATVDTELAGVPIAAGEDVVLRLPAANRDKAQFAEPLAPSLHRPDKRHLGYGRGIHVCPGAPLARAEMRIAWETLLARTSSIALATRADAVVAGGNQMTAAVAELYLDIRA